MEGSSPFERITELFYDPNLPQVYIETYGCQMNVADSEIVISIMQQNGYSITGNMDKADVILINTCSIRENAEQRIWGRLNVFKQLKTKNPGVLIGVIGCMAERLKKQLLEKEKSVDMVIGPDSYRDLPYLIHQAGTGQKVVNVLLSKEETYADISPVHADRNRISAFISIMRGCNNMCSYCVVPFVRGRERSRDPKSILDETGRLMELGYGEITLIGQNVDSYHWTGKTGNVEFRFHNLLESVARISPETRIRFATSHPKDMSDEVLQTMSDFKNICPHIHLPVQSGSSRILKLMNRGYTREWYKGRIEAIKRILPECSVTTDIIAGFCSETEEDHRLTLSLMEWAGFDFAYMFKYSERPGTPAAERLKDDVPEAVKSRRLHEIIDLQNTLSMTSKKKDVNRVFEVLAEGISKKSDQELFGRTSQNKVVVFPKNSYKIGDRIEIEIISCTSATLIGKPVIK
ncbi:MAG: tRNA (N6-isopentenyl adenosine(37)-C2)-methylthiotransferase MiaB [Bacteroidales bacterium]|nr:MAG: tRNA (N6-isopentenyl adenosine(37)-C2)-methylthiotransferase MiaB [Bacteroidales bacterium]